VKRFFPDAYREMLRLRMPHYVKLILTNSFPRTQVTARLTASQPVLQAIRTRAAAAVRASSRPVSNPPLSEDWSPLRIIWLHLRRDESLPAPVPASGREENQAVNRVAEFLSSPAPHRPFRRGCRDRLSEGLDFGGGNAAGMDQRVVRLSEVLPARSGA
jgi:hypothetical protein